LVLWAGAKRVERFAWPSGGARPPERSSGPLLDAGDTDVGWAANSRGDVVVLDRRARTLVALAIDATGAQASIFERAPRGRAVEELVAAIGPDGTSAVAWTLTETLGAAGSSPPDSDPTVHIRVRAPAGQFEPPAVVDVGEQVQQIDVQVGSDGRVELLIASFSPGLGRQLHHTTLRSGVAPAAPAPVLSTEPGSIFMALIAGGVGETRVLFDASMADYRVVATHRTQDGRWSSPEAIDAPALVERHSVAAGPGGLAVVAYQRRGRIFVRRAAADGPWRAPEPVARLPAGWETFTPTMTVGPAGHLLVTWIETSVGGHSRVRAAAANPERPFEHAQTVSPLGIAPAPFEPHVAGISPRGERLVAWWEAAGGVYRPGSLLVATGDETPVGAPATDRRPPRIRVTTSYRSLRALAADGVSKRQIAERLGINRRTVDRMVGFAEAAAL
jgi:hypothetical protein